MIELYIDVRERGLIEILKNQLEFKTKALDIGDVVFMDGDEIVLIIERKTILDLKASIIDGRRSEQHARLSTVPKERIIYLIEGDLNFPLEDKISSFPISTLVSSILNTQLRDGIHVYKTLTIDESCEYLRAIHAKLNKDITLLFGANSVSLEGIEASAHYCSTLHRQKKANMTPEVWFISQLCLIPQITEKVATEIVRKYPTVSSLCRAYDNVWRDAPIPIGEKSKADFEKRCVGLLSNITYQIKGGKSRRVGDKAAERIYKFFNGT